jgi:RNA polymerase sigma-70 factor (ECF subfamily)
MDGLAVMSPKLRGTVWIGSNSIERVLLAGLVQATGQSFSRGGSGRIRFAMPKDLAETDTATLLARCAAADGTAFRRLYESQSGRLYGVALRITRQPALASDAVHDALLQVWRNAARFDPDRGNADGWLLSLVRYRALDIARRQARETPGADIPEQADTDPDALARLVTGVEGRALRDCLEQVEAPRRSLVVLAFIEGLTQTEVATRVGQPLGTVKSSIRRALLSMRSCLERALGVSSAESQS